MNFIRKHRSEEFLYFRKNPGGTFLYFRVEGPYQLRWLRFSPGDTRKHPAGTQEAPRRHPGSSQEAPRKHPGGTQRHPEAPRAPQRLQEVLEAIIEPLSAKMQKVY